MTFRRVGAPLRGPGQSPVLPFACCVASLRSVGRCGRCSRWCRIRVRGAQRLVCWGCAECGMMCRLCVSGAPPADRPTHPNIKKTSPRTKVEIYKKEPKIGGRIREHKTCSWPRTHPPKEAWAMARAPQRRSAQRAGGGWARQWPDRRPVPLHHQRLAPETIALAMAMATQRPLPRPAIAPSLVPTPAAFGLCMGQQAQQWRPRRWGVWQGHCCGTATSAHSSSRCDGTVLRVQPLHITNGHKPSKPIQIPDDDASSALI